MATASLKASARSETGTGVARKLRQAGTVPAVIYGHGRQPQALTLNTREIDKLLTQISAASTVVVLDVDGATSRTLIREIQRHPFKRHIIHVDFQELVAGEKVTVYVPFRFVGVPDGVRNSGGILEETMHQVHVRVDPSLIPDHINVDVTPLTIGHSIHIRELALPEGVSVLDDANATVCVCTAPKQATETTPGTETEAAAGAPEPELIRKTKAEEDEESK
ncbi:MAG TPA: 50S ribosomal protein L25/general stress protein Ctc [Gemmatimonadaceae bacterium]|jgi:large subunit ribosomal protein L25|nr:50S ribosomal protein L25/general stress protein Ctc [Gemmatimonadaceae bacterium]